LFTIGENDKTTMETVFWFLKKLKTGLGIVTHACHPSFARGINRRTAVQSDLSKNHEIVPEKQPKQKELGLSLKW
jgi:hypothetical protein